MTTDRRRTRLRFRLCLAFTSILAVLMVGQAVYIGYTTSRESTASQQGALRRDAERLAVRLATGESVAEALTEFREEGLLRGETTLRQFIGADGSVLAESGPLAGTDPLLTVEEIGRVTGRGSSVTVERPDGRLPAYALAVPTSPPVVVIAMARRDFAAAQRARLVRFELLVIPLCTVLGAALAWFIIGRQLQRLRLIVRDATRVAAGDGGAPDASGPKDELFAISSALTEITGSLRRALDYQQRFAAQAAHELRTPLAIMKAESDLALSTDSLDDARQALASIGEETEKLAALVQDLLAFGQSSSSPSPVEDVAVADLVAAATQPLADLAASRGVGLRIEVGDGSLRVSRVGIEHAVRNLVENAIDAAPSGSEVRVSGVQDDGWWRLAVEDAGPGVGATVGDRLFEPFVSDRIGGHGLGLTFVKLIAEAHQGRATMERDPDGRTRFCLALPTGAPTSLRSSAPAADC